MDSATVFLAVAAVVLAPLVGYLAASRRLSGKIGTSDADALWDESKSIREDYRAQLNNANQRVLALEARVARCEATNTEVVRENIALQRRIDVLERENADLRGEIERLLEQLHREIFDD